MTQRNQVRIIAGKWRSRKVSFADVDGLRPTGDRIRETLFNWLMDDVRGRSCLDLFAGSGIFSFEALSRGAKSALAVDSSSLVAQAIRDNAAVLNADNLQVLSQDALQFLQQTTQQFDLLFLDPPFASDLLQNSIDILKEADCLTKGALIYCERPLEKSIKVPDAWQNLRKKQTKTLEYSLWQIDL